MIDFPKSPDESRSLSGQHKPSIGTSTSDKTDEQDVQSRLADFESAWEAIRFGCVSGREW